MRKGFEVTLSHGQVLAVVPHNAEECAVGDGNYVVYIDPTKRSHRVTMNALTKGEITVVSMVEKSFEDFIPTKRTSARVDPFRACVKCKGGNCCVINCCAQCSAGCPWVCDE